MKVYNFTGQQAQSRQAPKSVFSLGKSNHSGRSQTKHRSGLNFAGLLENKFASQVVAILFLTVAVFIAVQGLFGSNTSTVAQAAGVNEDVRLIINYNANGNIDKGLADNSTLIDTQQPVTVVVANNTTTSTNSKPENTPVSGKVAAVNSVVKK